VASGRRRVRDAAAPTPSAAVAPTSAAATRRTTKKGGGRRRAARVATAMPTPKVPSAAALSPRPKVATRCNRGTVG